MFQWKHCDRGCTKKKRYQIDSDIDCDCFCIYCLPCSKVYTKLCRIFFRRTASGKWFQFFLLFCQLVFFIEIGFSSLFQFCNKRKSNFLLSKKGGYKLQDIFFLFANRCTIVKTEITTNHLLIFLTKTKHFFSIHFFSEPLWNSYQCQ